MTHGGGQWRYSGDMSVNHGDRSAAARGLGRRHALGLVGAAAAALATGAERSQPIVRPFVLVHGAWHGAWCWERLTPLLSARGFWAVAPCLAGVGERAKEIGPHITLDTHVEETIALLNAWQMSDVILVGHSYAGAVITGVADRVPWLLRKLVYLDAVIPEPGKSLNGGTAQPNTSPSNRAVMPAVSPQSLGITDPADAAWAARRLTAHPINTFDQPIRIASPIGNGVPGAYIACTRPAMMPHAKYAAFVRTRPDWRMLELATGHEAMITAPRQLAAMLVDLAGD